MRKYVHERRGQSRYAQERIEAAPLESITREDEPAPDDSTAQLLAAAHEVLDSLQPGEAKREEPGEVEKFTDRIADVVAEKVVGRMHYEY